jgi:TPR repeat protein
MLEKRVDSNDVDAIYQFARLYLDGHEVLGITKDTDKAVEFFHRAAELGSVKAYSYLGLSHVRGGCVSKDDAKAKQYFEKAAMAGDADSRFNLGVMEFNADNFDRAIKHWLIAARCGKLDAVNAMKEAMTLGTATRDDYAQALQGYQHYVNDVRSEQRDRAAAYSDEYKYLET